MTFDIDCYQINTFSSSLHSLLTLQCIERKLAIANATYLDWLEKNCPEPSLRVISSRLLTDEDIAFVFDTIESISSELLSSV